MVEKGKKKTFARSQETCKEKKDKARNKEQRRLRELKLIQTHEDERMGTKTAREKTHCRG